MDEHRLTSNPVMSTVMGFSELSCSAATEPMVLERDGFTEELSCSRVGFG